MEVDPSSDGLGVRLYVAACTDSARRLGKRVDGSKGALGPVVMVLYRQSELKPRKVCCISNPPCFFVANSTYRSLCLEARNIVWRLCLLLIVSWRIGGLCWKDLENPICCHIAVLFDGVKPVICVGIIVIIPSWLFVL